MLVFMFPGQSSRYPDMINKIVAAWPQARDVIDAASDVLSRDLRAHYAAENENQFDCNRDIQVGVFLASHLHQLVLADGGVTGDLSLGLSLGEYNHLVHIGALDFESALTLVNARGEAYDCGPEGMMASIFPLPLEDLEPYLKQVQHLGAVQVANINSPSQNVIAGDRVAVEAAIDLIDGEDMGVQAVPIEHRIPMHTLAFEPVASGLRPHLEKAPWQRPTLPYIPNLRAEMLHGPETDDIIASLEQHVFKPVQWRQSIDLIAEHHPDARFVEVGPGGVLYNLLQRSWRKEPRFKTDSTEDLAAHLSSTVTELANAA